MHPPRLQTWTKTAAALMAVAWTTTCRATTSLPAYQVDPSTVTVAGLSSGAFMAVQLQVAYSSHIHGAAIMAGGPFYCAQDSESSALGDCLSGTSIPLQSLVDYTNNQASAGTIDSPANLAHQPVYLFSGTNDTTVHPAVMNTLQQYYQAFSVSNLTYNNSTPAAHSWVTPDGPNTCDSSYSPYINNCSIDPEHDFLTQFYGTLQAKNTGTLSGSYVQFDQTPFCAGGSCSSISLDSSGWAFVPQSCANGDACRLLLVLHGCEQSQSAVGEDLVQESGVNEWADTNGIIVLYPQATTSSSNPDGCWDWWGYTTANYALQSAPQMQSLMAMVDQITGQTIVPATTGTSSGSTSGASTTGGGNPNAGTCTTLGLSCSGGQECCAGSACQWGYCLPITTTATGSTGLVTSTTSSGNTSSSGSGSSGPSTASASSSSGTPSSASSSSSSSGHAGTAFTSSSSSSSSSSGSSAAGSSSSGGSSSGSTGSSSFTPSSGVTLTSIAPVNGSTLVNTPVTLEGSGFVPWAQVLIGSVPMETVYVQSPSVITAVVGSGIPGGTYDVTLVNPDGTKVVLKAAFTVVEPAGCSTGLGGPSLLGLLAMAALGRRRRRGLRSAMVLAVGVTLAAAIPTARADTATVATDAPTKPEAPAILGPQGAVYLGAAVSTTPAALVGFFPVDHLAITGGLALSVNGNGSAASPLTGMKGTTASKVGSDLFLDGLYFIHDRAPFATGPELNLIASLAPYGPFLTTVITPMWAVRYAPWKAPIAIGTGVGVSFTFIKGMQPIVGIATQGLDIVYAF